MFDFLVWLSINVKFYPGRRDEKYHINAKNNSSRQPSQVNSPPYKQALSRIRLVVVRLGIIDRSITLNRLWKPFVIIWTTRYNLRKCAVEHACKFTATYVENTYQICKYTSCFHHECLASFLKQDGVNFGKDRLSVVIDRMVYCLIFLYYFMKSWKKANVPMNISEKNETKAKHIITFKTSNSVNGWSVSSVAMTTMTFQNGRKLTFNPHIS